MNLVYEEGCDSKREACWIDSDYKEYLRDRCECWTDTKNIIYYNSSIIQ
jgi:hypothetical protein